MAASNFSLSQMQIAGNAASLGGGLFVDANVAEDVSLAALAFAGNTAVLGEPLIGHIRTRLCGAPAASASVDGHAQPTQAEQSMSTSCCAAVQRDEVVLQARPHTGCTLHRRMSPWGVLDVCSSPPLTIPPSTQSR